MDQTAEPEGLDWRDGNLPVSRRYDDPFYGGADGLAEKRHVFLDGNDLGTRFAGARDFVLAELGFGTGLTVLAAWALWRARAHPGAVLRVTSFEQAPLPRQDLARALGRWPELARETAALVAVWTGAGRYRLEGLDLEIVSGDARDRVPGWDGIAQAWCLDGFAPSRNPQMWEPGLIAAVFARTAPGGTAATYSAAGTVRHRLAAAGFAVVRTPGHGRKRHMTRATRPIS